MSGFDNSNRHSLHGFNPPSKYVSDETTPEPQVSGALPPLPDAQFFGVSRFGSVFYGYEEQAMQAYATEARAPLLADRDRLLSALRKLVNEPQDITSKAYRDALGVLGEFDS
jgi:hypothetical protein